MYLMKDSYPDYIKNSPNSAVACPAVVNSSDVVAHISKKRKFVVDDIFRAKLNEFSIRGLLKMASLELRSRLYQPGQESLPGLQDLVRKTSGSRN